MSTRFYQAPGLDIGRIASEFEASFLSQGYQVQHFGNRQQMVVQIRKGGDFEAVLGMQAAVTVTLQPVPGGVITSIGQQQWVDKAAVGAIGMFFLFWPLMLTAGAGIIRQIGLEGQIISALDGIVLHQRSDVRIGDVPPQYQDQFTQQTPPPPHPNMPPQQHWQGGPVPPQAPAEVPCPYCKGLNEVGDAFCSHCGKSLRQQKLHCPNCHAEVKPDAAFCPKCGTSLQQQEKAPEESVDNKVE